MSSIGLPFPGKDLMQKYADEKQPLRAELFNADQMEQHGRQLGIMHKLDSGHATNSLLKRLSENEALLLEVQGLLTEAVKTNRRIIPAGEWLLDNFYLIQEQIRTGRKHLPKGYSEDLPRLLNGPSKGLPRVYDISTEIISHSDGRVDLKSLGSFITAYQAESPLKLGELWAIPIMLRLALIENIRRLAAHIAYGRINQNLADFWAEQMITTAENDPKSLILIIADMARSNPPLVSSFVAELTRQLQGKGPALALPLNWMEQRFSESGHTSAEIINTEIQQQAADQVSMSNSIGSLRFLGTMDWKEFVESNSIIEEILRMDITGIYPKMDFSTRDHYRHLIEHIAHHSEYSEQEVANMAIHLGKIAHEKHGADDRSSHVGYYLLGKGVEQIEKGAKLQLPYAEKLQKMKRRLPFFSYISEILLITVLFGSALTFKAYYDGTGKWLLVAVAMLSFLCASHLAVAFVNWITSLYISPQLLPRMDFKGGIPPECRTMVVIPSMLTSHSEIENLAESLEVYYLANKEEHLHFGLLTDFGDARQESMPGDEQLIQKAVESMALLNQKYALPGNDIFFLFHRPRKWNPYDKVWMGYERKRGKLTELNALLRGEAKSSFSHTVGDQRFFPEIKYVITIDSDTQLPRDAARQIIATMAHPMNKAHYNEKKQRVTEGYGILQPRIAVSMAGSTQSLYTRMHGNDLGIDPYTRTTSDVYQDLFEEGSFIGKGIYEVDIFRKGLDERFPENRILSHDLLEGCLLRSGLISDIQLYESYPSSYSADAKRIHRWIRGDWQIAAWIFPFIRSTGKGFQKNPLTRLSRWKILDNLRRSLIPTALLVLLLAGWTILHNAWFWTLATTGILLLPIMISSVHDILIKPREILMKQHVKDSIHAIINNFILAFFSITCLPFEALFTADAIARTNWRMIISHKKLLEWSTSASQQYNTEDDLWAKYRSMWIAPLLSIAGLVFLTIFAPLDHLVADPILALWIASPAIAWFISRPLGIKSMVVSPDQKIFLRKIARKTWAFFENFVTAEDHWLPPDNYQEHPVERIAHRTSPTNIGLSLMANLSALDFGYITAGQFIERSMQTLHTMQNMQRYKGHFYNWYDTHSLLPLPPHYISTVDSGNLAGHLLTLRQGIKSIPDQKILGPQILEGLNDTLSIFIDTLINPALLQSQQKSLLAIGNNPELNIFSIEPFLSELTAAAENAGAPTDDAGQGEKDYWSGRLVSQCNTIREVATSCLLWSKDTPIPEKFRSLAIPALTPTLRELADMELDLAPDISAFKKEDLTPGEMQWLDGFALTLEKCSRFARQRITVLAYMEDICQDLSALEYDFLYDKSQHLLTIGFNTEDQRKDPSYYDLLASEARLASFVGISQGKLPQESWFSLGRQLTKAGGSSLLLSWSGSMFEYLMPVLIMPTYENTLLDQTYKTMVKRQIEYGNQLGVPWGISESGYNQVDAILNYQYRAFGVPEMGLKRGLSEDLVIAPYASVMALMIDPEEACRNLQQLSDDGMVGRYGYYEAIDYTPARVPRGQEKITIRSFMAHHQGMSLLALDYLLQDMPMQKRFEREPIFQATLLLLQERIPKATKFFSLPPDVADISFISEEPEMRIIKSVDTPVPEVQLLSNGTYHVMVTHAGGGYSRWKNIAVTRWREDATCDNWGNFCYIRDLEKGIFWSTGYQPSRTKPKQYEAVFSQGRAEFRRHDFDIETHTEIAVSPEDDVEIRRVHLTNRSRKRRSIEVTSYAEVVLASSAADALHPAFSNLFVQTEILPDKHAIVCTRRPRSAEEKDPWMFHLMIANSGDIREVSYETDRMQFIGRGNNVSNPLAMNQDKALGANEGSVLDPIVSIQYRLFMEPLETIIIDMVTGIGDTREITEGLLEKYQDTSFMDRAFELAWTHSQMALRQLNATEADAQLYTRLANSVIYSNAVLRAEPAILIKNQRGQSGLWSYSISGDLPIVLLQVSDIANIGMVKQLVQAHAYWRMKGLIVDLVIWNEDYGGYRQLLQNQLTALLSAGVDAETTERPGGIFVRVAEQIAIEDRILIQSVARVVLSDTKGSLISQVNKRIATKALIPALVPNPATWPIIVSTPKEQELLDFNGIGGFSADGKEYVIRLHQKSRTPMPWVNVLANNQFGSVISEGGQSYTWVENAHEFRLTPWNNDPVSDTAGEIFYLRDEENGRYWPATALRGEEKIDYTTRHGFGYSIFEHHADGIHTQMQVFVDLHESVKFTVLRLKNYANRPRKISVTGYVEWVLGDMRPKTAMHVFTETDPATGAIMAKNTYNKEFNDRVCFFDANQPVRSITCDRTEFIGRNGSIHHPDAMSKTHLSGKTGAALDPCGAIQVIIDLPENQEYEIIFSLGTAASQSDASSMVQHYRKSGMVAEALEKVRSYWQKTLGSVELQTPDSGLNLMGNGWLLYQTLACRFHARSGFYQSGGALGFRDQLQDAMALMNAEPKLVRNHILLCASRQFKEGDVQHWWHPPSGRGVRTRCSDDYLWLPFTTYRYVQVTGDSGILDEQVHFIEGRSLNADEESYYDLPNRTAVTASLYDHCVRAILYGLKMGPNGLPLIGSGDWNDGMDKVGLHGKGESVWLGFFLYDVLIKFSELAQIHYDTHFSAQCREEAYRLSESIEKSAWDGEWYRRAFFDDGTPLGSSENQECKIDSIAQSWSVLSKAGDKARTTLAMDSAYKYLVRKDKSIIQLLDPPFNKSDLNPGYIKGYVPGVRENGGQYTHAAIWLIMAFAQMKKNQRVWELFSLINPVNHGNTAEKISVYKVEPYVVAADIYSDEKHSGRGGWTWYTGSAGWMYRLIHEYIIGITRENDNLIFNPCIPDSWDSFAVNYHFMDTAYRITYRQKSAETENIVLSLDGVEQEKNSLRLINDLVDHFVTIDINRI